MRPKQEINKIFKFDATSWEIAPSTQNKSQTHPACMTNIIDNEKRFKSFNHSFWLFALGFPVIVLSRILIDHAWMDWVISAYSVFFIGFMLFARFIAVPTYFRFSIDKQRIQIRYRPFNFFDMFGMFSKEGVSELEIESYEFDGYRIKNKFAGMRRSLVLYQTDRAEKVINISYLSVAEITSLVRSLHNFNYDQAVANDPRVLEPTGVGLESSRS